MSTVVTGKKSSGDIPDLSSSGCRGEGLTTGLLGGLLTGLLVLLDLVGAGCLTGSISPSYKINSFYAMCRQEKLNTKKKLLTKWDKKIKEICARHGNFSFIL